MFSVNKNSNQAASSQYICNDLVLLFMPVLLISFPYTFLSKLNTQLQKPSKNSTNKVFTFGINTHYEKLV